MVFLFNLIWSLFSGQAGRRQSLARHDARVADARDAAAAWQLGQGAAGGLSLGLRLQRARRRGGFHPAEPAGDPRGRLGRPRHERRILVFWSRSAAIVVWWLSQQRLTAKPWLEDGPIGDVRGTDASSLPAAKIGLGVFLAVVGSLFALLHQRLLHAHAAWRTGGRCPEPTLLWLNTGVLIAEQRRAAVGAGRRARGATSTASGPACSPAALLALAFLAGQLLAWRQLSAAGYFAGDQPGQQPSSTCSPALHGLHVLGGLVALGQDRRQGVARRRDASSVRLERGALRHLLALPAARLAGSVRAAAVARLRGRSAFAQMTRACA